MWEWRRLRSKLPIPHPRAKKVPRSQPNNSMLFSLMWIHSVAKSKRPFTHRTLAQLVKDFWVHEPLRPDAVPKSTDELDAKLSRVAGVCSQSRLRRRFPSLCFLRNTEWVRHEKYETVEMTLSPGKCQKVYYQTGVVDPDAGLESGDHASWFEQDGGTLPAWEVKSVKPANQHGLVVSNSLSMTLLRQRRKA